MFRKSGGFADVMSAGRFVGLVMELTADGQRVCGPCNVCCTTMQVRALHKPAGMRCIHQIDSGCGVYEHRPDACRDWYCMWVRDRGSVFTDDQRPDRLRLIFTAAPADAVTGRQAINAHEVVRGGSGTPAGRAAITFLAQFARVQIVPYHEPATQMTPVTLRGGEMPGQG